MQLNHSQRFDNLDVVRFIIALLLIFFHSYSGWKENFGSPSFVLNEAGNNFSQTGLYFDRFIRNLTLGGDVFFLISGFLIAMTLLREQDASGDIYIRGFYMRRALRILPLYILVIALSPLLTGLLGENDPNYLSWIFLYGNNELAYNGWGPMATNFLWFITIEMQFYIVIPVALVIIRRKYLPLFFLLLIFASFLFRIYSFKSAIPWNMIYLHTFSRMDALLVGCWFGLVFYQRKNLLASTSLPMKLIVYIAFIYLLFVDDYTNYGTLFAATTKKYTYLAFTSFILANFVFNSPAKKGRVGWNIFSRMGRASYGLFIYSNLAAVVMIDVCKNQPSIKNFWLYLLIINIIVIPLALLSYNYIELPIMNLKRFFVRALPAQKTEQVS